MPEELGLSLEATSDRGLLEMGVAVCAMRPLKTGLVLRLEEGKTVLQNLEVFSSLQPDDVRGWCDGCVDYTKKYNTKKHTLMQEHTI